jgi:hypothetical protein
MYTHTVDNHVGVVFIKRDGDVPTMMLMRFCSMYFSWILFGSRFQFRLCVTFWALQHTQLPISSFCTNTLSKLHVPNVSKGELLAGEDAAYYELCTTA